MATPTIIGVTPDYIVRMNQEQHQLNTRVTQLAHFTSTPQFEGLPDDDQHLLAAQLFAMQTYSAILDMRINRAARRTAN